MRHLVSLTDSEAVIRSDFNIASLRRHLLQLLRATGRFPILMHTMYLFCCFLVALNFKIFVPAHRHVHVTILVP